MYFIAMFMIITNVLFLVISLVMLICINASFLANLGIKTEIVAGRLLNIQQGYWTARVAGLTTMSLMA